MTKFSGSLGEFYVFRKIKAITDNPEFADRYSIYLEDGAVISMSEDPLSPLGVSQWGEGAGEPDREREISFQDLPERVQKHLLFMLDEGILGEGE